MDPTKNFATTIAVSFWGSNAIAVIALNDPGLKTVCSVSLPALPRSVLLHNFGSSSSSKDPNYRPHLLAGLADGTLITFALRDGTLVDRKTSSLGNAPVSLSVCTIDRRRAVFASGTRTNILFWDRQRLKPSPTAIRVCIVSAFLRSLKAHDTDS